ECFGCRNDFQLYRRCSLAFEDIDSLRAIRKSQFHGLVVAECIVGVGFDLCKCEAAVAAGRYVVQLKCSGRIGDTGDVSVGASAISRTGNKYDLRAPTRVAPGIDDTSLDRRSGTERDVEDVRTRSHLHAVYQRVAPVVTNAACVHARGHRLEEHVEGSRTDT